MAADSAPFFVETASGPIHCRFDGAADAPCVVMSNSHATDLGMWDALVPPLARQWRVLRYDQRGHGRTPATPAPYAFDMLAEDVVAVMDGAGVDRAVLLGISMGAVTVLRAAARWPRRVSAVIACDGQWKSPAIAEALWAIRIAQVLAIGTSSLARETVTRWFRPGFAERAPDTAAAVERMISATSVTGYVGCAQAMQHYDFSADYPGLPMPVMYLAGREDGALPAVMRTMAAATPGAVHVEIDDAGHLPAIEQPQAFLAAVTPFLDRALR